MVAHAPVRAANGEAAAVELPVGWEATVVERYLGGESGRAIANDLGVSRPRVYGVLRERGLIRSASEARKLEEARRRAAKGREPRPAASGARRKPWPWPAELADLVVERYSAGESGETIAVDLGLSHWRVYKLLRERGVLRTLKQASVLREERRRREDNAPGETS